MLEVINKILESSNQYANLILVLITAVYAYMTYETVKIMRRQVTANIRIAKIHLRVSAEGKRDGFKISAFKDLARRPYGALKDVTFIFRMFADFVNISYGAGAVDQPKLLIKFDHSNFELEVRPTSERIGATRRTIVIPGNGFEKIDLDYFVSFNARFLEHLKRFPDGIEYYVRYRDNSGHRHKVRIDEIDGLK
ncbi:MAG: hypothetical protein PHE24_02185 [Patescibacteria group bacterium]|nr:hypothetical protein [Patescibacteria group bacterium]